MFSAPPTSRVVMACRIFTDIPELALLRGKARRGDT
jgi:hypothetical protein